MQFLWCFRHRRPWPRPMTCGHEYLHAELYGQQNILRVELQYLKPLWWRNFQLRGGKNGGRKQCICCGDKQKLVNVQSLGCYWRPCWCLWSVLPLVIMFGSIVLLHCSRRQCWYLLPMLPPKDMWISIICPTKGGHVRVQCLLVRNHVNDIYSPCYHQMPCRWISVVSSAAWSYP